LNKEFPRIKLKTEENEWWGNNHQRRICVTIDLVRDRNACPHPVADSRKRLCSAAANANEPNRSVLVYEWPYIWAESYAKQFDA